MKSFKIIMSPSKTQQVKCPAPLNKKFVKPLNEDSQRLSEVLLHRLKALDAPSLSKALSVKGKLLEETLRVYSAYEESPEICAVSLYTGSVFKALNLKEYSPKQLAYMEEHLCILSAFYGIVGPFERIRPYRLDMTCKVFESSSYDYWKPRVNEVLSSADVIVNLASDEFSALVERPMINIVFKDRNAEGHLVIKSTYAKMARGQMIHFAICEQIKNVKHLQKFNWEGYTFTPSESNEREWLWIR